MAESLLIWLVLLAQADRATEALAAASVNRIAESGRVVGIAATPSERADAPRMIAPGAPPLLSFRFFDGKDRHRFGNLDLVMDDAGH